MPVASRRVRPTAFSRVTRAEAPAATRASAAAATSSRTPVEAALQPRVTPATTLAAGTPPGDPVVALDPVCPATLTTMPELPEVEAVRRLLEPAMRGRRIDHVELRRSDLRVPFTEGLSRRVTGCKVREVARRAKYLLIHLSSGDTLLTHLGMSGWFEVEPPSRRGNRRAADAHDHVVLRMASGTTITFNDPRRFGLMQLLTPVELATHPVLARLGPEPLSEVFDADSLARACRGRRVSLKTALLDQRVVAGLGNIYAAEALHVAGLSPRRRASTITTRTGAPRESAHRLVAGVKDVLRAAIARQLSGAYGSARFRVYDRERRACARRGCRGAIVRITQGGRSTFYCPICQR
jgi:formamidopyrimidine-DNA glycosylase